MASSPVFRAVELESGTFVVVSADADKPLVLEVVATFYDAARAQEYAARENARVSAEPEPEVAPKAPPAVAPKAPPKVAAKAAPKSAPKAAPKEKAVEAAPASDLTDRQNAVLGALRMMADADNSVEAKAAALADAAGVPLGSLHSILQSLEKKALIRNTRPGSAKASAVYQIL
jgi:hypothetical protein